MKPLTKMPDTELLSWSANLSKQLNLSPNEFHIQPAQAELYRDLHEVFGDLLSLWRNPDTRTPVASQAKQAARKNLVASARNLVATINSNPLTTNGQRTELGIPLRKQRSQNPIPQTVPVIAIIDVRGHTVTFGLSDIEGGRPDRVAGAEMYTFVGENPPKDLSGWVFQGTWTRRKGAIVFPPTVEPRTKVWLIAAWVNARNQRGAVGTSVSAHIQFGELTLPILNVVRKVA